jgi:hypothetical protein
MAKKKVKVKTEEKVYKDKMTILNEIRSDKNIYSYEIVKSKCACGYGEEVVTYNCNREEVQRFKVCVNCGVEE